MRSFALKFPFPHVVFHGKRIFLKSRLGGTACINESQYPVRKQACPFVETGSLKKKSKK